LTKVQKLNNKILRSFQTFGDEAMISEFRPSNALSTLEGLLFYLNIKVCPADLLLTIKKFKELLDEKPEFVYPEDPIKSQEEEELSESRRMSELLMS